RLFLCSFWFLVLGGLFFLLFFFLCRPFGLELGRERRMLGLASLETGSCAGVVASGGDVGIWVAVPRRDAVAMPCGDLLAGI
ncbi:hypothetical protein, partial [Nocardia gipuzkoensis]